MALFNKHNENRHYPPHQRLNFYPRKNFQSDHRYGNDYKQAPMFDRAAPAQRPVPDGPNPGSRRHPQNAQDGPDPDFRRRPQDERYIKMKSVFDDIKEDPIRVVTQALTRNIREFMRSDSTASKDKLFTKQEEQLTNTLNSMQVKNELMFHVQGLLEISRRSFHQLRIETKELSQKQAIISLNLLRTNVTSLLDQGHCKIAQDTLIVLAYESKFTYVKFLAKLKIHDLEEGLRKHRVQVKTSKLTLNHDAAKSKAIASDYLKYLNDKSDASQMETDNAPTHVATTNIDDNAVVPTSTDDKAADTGIDTITTSPLNPNPQFVINQADHTGNGALSGSPAPKRANQQTSPANPVNINYDNLHTSTTEQFFTITDEFYKCNTCGWDVDDIQEAHEHILNDHPDYLNDHRNLKM